MVQRVDLLWPPAGLALALLLAQVLARCLARGLSVRLPAAIQLIALAAPLALLLPLLAGHRLLAPADAPILANLPDAPQVEEPDLAHGVFNDAILQLLPWEAEVRRGFAEGHLPLWSDLLDGGSSPWVNPQAAILSPIAMLARLLPLAHFLLGALAVKILLAFEGTWLLARALGAGRWSAALGAGAFALGGPILAWAVFPLSSVVAWSPWLLLATLRVVRRPARRHVVTAALVLAALLLSGHPEIALAECLLAAGFGALVRRRHGRRFEPLGAAVLAAALGGGLAACQLVPFALVVPHSLRAAHAGSPEVVDAARLLPSGEAARPETADAPHLFPAGEAGRPVTAEAARLFPVGDERLFLSVLNPWSFGRPFHEPFAGPGNWPIATGAYLGLVALAGAAAGLASRRWRLAGALLVLALGLLLLAAGFLPIRLLLGALPLGGALARNRLLAAAALPLALLAALGVDALLRRRSRAAVGAALLAALASLAVRPAAFVVALWGLIALAVVLGRHRRALGLAGLTLATLLDLGTWDRDVLPRGHRELFYPRTPLVAAVKSVVATGGPWRAVAGGFALYPSLLPAYGIAEVRIDNPLALDQALRPLSEIFDFRPEGRRYKSAFRHLDRPFLDFLNARVVVVGAADPLPARLVQIGAAGGSRLLLNPAALPRYFLPAGASECGRAEALACIGQIRDARHVVLITEELGGWHAPERRWEPAAIVVTAARRGRISLRLPAAGEKLLATSLPFPAGWRAAAGGRALRRLTVNTAYFGAIVPAGATRVDLSFAPPGFRLGATLTMLSAAALLLLAAWPRRVPIAGSRA
jgi:hypothetical protein